MKLRHVRAVAVFGIAVVALTGARGSHGGSCGGGHSSSSSSSSGGDSSSSSSSSGGDYQASTGGYDGSSSSSGGSSSSTTTGGTDSSSSSSTTGSVPGTGGSSSASRDLRISECKYDPSRGMLANITATNSSSSSTYTYSFMVKFTNSGSTVGTRSTSIAAVAPGQSRSIDVATPFVKKSTESLIGRCEVKYVTRTSS
ncbi:hypothetical protein ACH4SP_30075 [Streptomyces sp. NPDC021093]|uniref:hypothetical protein n=1 Tax=Streptomyces sp. NPDC021093 TaxID=3365112 RepID=UPI0037B82A5D